MFTRFNVQKTFILVRFSAAAPLFTLGVSPCLFEAPTLKRPSLLWWVTGEVTASLFLHQLRRNYAGGVSRAVTV